ncbi:MAG TPA: DMT family transporter, partial [Casimicrobiaceae bacterium]|nr:DMT family transporter [Casimicrobiaceae bacterium]
MIDPLPRVSAPARPPALASLHAAVLLFGLAGLFGKWIDLPAAEIVFGRAAIAAAALGVLLMRSPTMRAGFEWPMAINGAVLALHWWAFFKAIQLSSVAIGLLGYASFPLFVVLLEAGWLRVPLRGVDLATAGLVVAGLLVLIPEIRADAAIAGGLAWGVVSGFSFAFLAVGNRALVPRRPPQAIAFWQNTVAAVCLAPALIAAPIVPGGRDLALLLVLGIACTALAHTLFIASMRTLRAHTAGIVAALEPVYGIALAALLLHELPAPRTIAGAALLV